MADENPNMPWSLIGVSDEARRQIRIAAAESDQTIGHWLNDRILRASAAAAPESGGYDGNTPSPTRDILARMQRILSDAEDNSSRELAAFAAALDALAIRLDELETPADSAGPGSPTDR